MWWRRSWARPNVGEERGGWGMHEMDLRDWRGGFCFEMVVVVEGKYGDFLVEERRAFLAVCWVVGGGGKVGTGGDVGCGGEGGGFLCRRDDRVLVEGAYGDGDGALAAGVRSAASSVVENASSRCCC